MSKVKQIRKRDGSIVRFEPAKIEQAIYKALVATKAGHKQLAAGLANRVIAAPPGLVTMKDLPIVSALGLSTRAGLKRE